jgi:O-antigen ligase
MRTKLAVFCDKVLEAGWLIAVVIVPLFFNVYSSRVFEPDKLSILRSIALIMISAWLIKVLDGSALGESRADHSQGAPEPGGVGFWTRVKDTPLVVPTLLLVGAYILSTILSVAPRISFWGSYMRLQGTYTTFSYIIIFFLMLATVRQRDQVNRLLTAIILTSLPVALYGILQHYNKDPLPWSGDVTLRVAGNMGNAIFVAAYLIMAFPVTLARLLDSFSGMFREQDSGVSHAILAGCYAFILAVNAVCVFFTQSRGPWLGLMGGVYVFMLITLVSLRHSLSDQSRLSRGDILRAVAFSFLSVPVGIVPAYAVMVILKRGLRWLWLGLVIQTVLVGSLLLVFNLPNTPLSPLRELPYLGRLGNLLQTEGGTGKVRVLIWEGALDMIAANPFRTIVGYGPETMHVAYNPYYPPDLAHYEARNASPDRAHNETIDALSITGVIGFVIQMILFGSLFYFGLKWLGFMETDRERKWFWTLSVGGAVAGAFLPRLLQGSFILSGVGLPVGFILGMSIYLMLSAAFFYRTTEQESAPLRNRMLLIALFSSIVAHYIEIHFGIAIASTRVHFWVYAALVVLLGLNRISDRAAEEPVPEAARQETTQYGRLGRKSQRQARRLARHDRVTTTPAAAPSPSLMPKVLAVSLIAAVILITLAFDFVTNPMGELDTVRIMQLSLTTYAPKGDAATSSPGVLLLLFLECCNVFAGCVVVALPDLVSRRARRTCRGGTIESLA